MTHTPHVCQKLGARDTLLESHVCEIHTNPKLTVVKVLKLPSTYLKPIIRRLSAVKDQQIQSHSVYKSSCSRSFILPAWLTEAVLEESSSYICWPARLPVFVKGVSFRAQWFTCLLLSVVTESYILPSCLCWLGSRSVYVL